MLNVKKVWTNIENKLQITTDSARTLHKKHGPINATTSMSCRSPITTPDRPTERATTNAIQWQCRPTRATSSGWALNTVSNCPTRQTTTKRRLIASKTIRAGYISSSKILQRTTTKNKPPSSTPQASTGRATGSCLMPAGRSNAASTVSSWSFYGGSPSTKKLPSPTSHPANANGTFASS